MFRETQTQMNRVYELRNRYSFMRTRSAKLNTNEHISLKHVGLLAVSPSGFI